MEQSTRRRLDLAGQWDLAFDAGDKADSGWLSGEWPAGTSESVAVPALWTVTHPDRTGIGFYHKTIAIPSEWQGQAVRLCIAGASYRLDGWLNGSYIGSHEGAYTPFWLDISRAMRAGTPNELVLRVAGLSKTEPVDGLVLQQCPASKQSWYYIEAGLWGDVYLEVLPALWCESVSVEPDLQGQRIVVEVEVRNATTEPRQAELRLRVTDPSGQTTAEAGSLVSLLPGPTCHIYRILLPRPIPWSCENPALYHLQVTLQANGGEADHLSVAFGMRDFSVDKGQFLLNGQPIYLRGVILQPNYPVNLICPPTPEMMRQEIRLARDAGFNLIRTHIRPSSPGFLDLCDELGMLVYAESSLAWIKDSPRLLEHGRREIAAMIGRDRNHPSVVIWGVLNENRPATALVADDLLRFVRALDPTRVVVDNSGGSLAIDQDFGWVDRATVLANRATERQKIIDIHVYIGAPAPEAAGDWLRTLGSAAPPVDMPGLGIGLPAVLEEFYRELHSYQGKIFVSELGCGGMSDIRDTVKRFAGRDLVDARELAAFCAGLEQGFKERHLEHVFGSLDNLIGAAQDQQAVGDIRQIEAVLANPRASGYCVTQLNDVAWEFHAGILDIWRQPKRVYEALKRVNRPHCVILKAASVMAACNSQVPVNVTVVDTIASSAPGTVVVIVRGADQIEQKPVRLAVPAGAGVKELATVTLDTGSEPGLAGVVALLYDHDGHLLSETTESVVVLPQADASAACRQVSWLGMPPDALAATAWTTNGKLLGVAQPGLLAAQDWRGLLATVADGAVAIIGPLKPTDEAAISALAEGGRQVRVEMGIGSWMGCYHWLPASRLGAGLPAGSLAGEAYTSVLPRYILSEQGGDVLAGSLRNTNSRFESPAMLWFSDAEAVALGRGMLLFCQYRIFDKQQNDKHSDNPLAARLLANLVQVAQGYLSSREGG